jgi:hypothetical protein
LSLAFPDGLAQNADADSGVSTSRLISLASLVATTTGGAFLWFQRRGNSTTRALKSQINSAIMGHVEDDMGCFSNDINELYGTF